MKLLAALVFLAGCYLSQLPITPQIAARSTFEIASQDQRDVETHGAAWAIDERHLITAGSLCVAAENVALHVDHGWLPVVAHVDLDGVLCLLDAPAHVRLTPLVLANDSSGFARAGRSGIAGVPLWTQLGVVGVELASGAMGLDGIRWFAARHGVPPTIAPPLSDLDMDLSCPPDARAHGGCAP